MREDNYARNSLPALFSTIVHMHRSLMYSILRERGLTEVSNPRLLMLIGRAESDGKQISQRELAEHMHSSPPSIAVSLKRMEKGGLIIRETAADDSRRNIIRLTQRGREMVHKGHEAAVAAEEALFNDFDAAERAILQDLFLRMIDNLQQLGAVAPGAPCAKHQHDVTYGGCDD